MKRTLIPLTICLLLLFSVFSGSIDAAYRPEKFTVRQQVAFWYENGWPASVGYARRVLSNDDFSLSWHIGLTENTAENQADLLARLDDPLEIIFETTERSFAQRSGGFFLGCAGGSRPARRGLCSFWRAKRGFLPCFLPRRFWGTAFRFPKHPTM